MRPRDTLKRLEREAQGFYENLTLQDSTQIKYESYEMLAAYAAYMEGRDHWLLPYILQADIAEGVPGMIRMIEDRKELNSGD
jgi:hypothetical protein